MQGKARVPDLWWGDSWGQPLPGAGAAFSTEKTE